MAQMWVKQITQMWNEWETINISETLEMLLEKNQIFQNTIFTIQTASISAKS